MEKPFAPQIDKIEKALNGDLGIADSMFKAIMSPLASAIPDEAMRKDFTDKAKLPDGIGLKPLEMVIISSMMESQKPLIELSKVFLELFSKFEKFLAKVNGLPNPAFIPETFTKLKKKIDKLKPQSEQLKDTKPTSVLLGVFDANGAPLTPESGEIEQHIWATHFTQIKSEQQLRSIRENELKTQLDGVENKEELSKSILDNVSKEWDGMQDKKQVTKNVPDTLKYWFYPQKVTFNDAEQTINPEDDYTIDVSENNGRFRFVANPARDLATGVPLELDGLPTYPPLPQLAPVYFAADILPVILGKLLPLVQLLTKVTTDPTAFFGEIGLAKIKEKYTVLNDKERAKPLYGEKVINFGGAAIGYKLDESGISMVKSAGKLPLNPVFDTILGFLKLPFELLKGILKAVTDLIKKIVTIVEIPFAIVDFLTFKWLKDLLSPEKLFEFMGAQAGKIETIPFLSALPAPNLPNIPDTMLQFAKMLQDFLSAFIQMPQDIFGVDLGLSIKLV